MKTTKQYPFSKIGDANFEFIPVWSKANWDSEIGKEFLKQKEHLGTEYKGNFTTKTNDDRASHGGNYIVKIDNQMVGHWSWTPFNMKPDPLQYTNKDFSSAIREYYNHPKGPHQFDGWTTDISKFNGWYIQASAQSKLYKMLDTVYVKPEYRSFGIATRIYDKAIKDFHLKGVLLTYQHYLDWHKGWDKRFSNFVIIARQQMQPYGVMLSLYNDEFTDISDWMRPLSVENVKDELYWISNNTYKVMKHINIERLTAEIREYEAKPTMELSQKLGMSKFLCDCAFQKLLGLKRGYSRIGFVEERSNIPDIPFEYLVKKNEGYVDWMECMWQDPNFRKMYKAGLGKAAWAKTKAVFSKFLTKKQKVTV